MPPIITTPLALVGGCAPDTERTERSLQTDGGDKSAWLQACAVQKAVWQTFKSERLIHPILQDEYWGAPC